MTNHKQAAIEALQQMTLTGNRQLIPAQAKDCVEAALPHIRAMIAEEIRSDIAARTWYEPIQLGMKRAANIAEEGPQQ